MPPKRLGQQDVAEILKPYYDRLWRCGALPFYEYLEKYPNTSIHSLRTRANIVHDLMIHRMRAEFDGMRGARIIDLSHPYERTLLEVNHRLLIRFKKLDESKLARNYRTKFIRDYEQDTDLPGIPPKAHRLTLGYRLNLLQTEVLDVSVTSCIGRRLEYDIELYIPNRKIVSIAEATSIYSEVGPRRCLVRVRIAEQKKFDDQK